MEHRAVLLLWISAIAALGLAAGTAWYLAPLEPGVLALQFAFTPGAFGEVIHAWPPEHLQRFRAHLPVDFALLLCYGAFGYLLAARTKVFAPLSATARVLAMAALPLAAACDAAENALHCWLTEVPRFGLEPVYLLAASCASMKWALAIIYALILLYAVHQTET